MTEQEIREFATNAEKATFIACITHPKNPNVIYEVAGFIKVTNEAGEWFELIEYWDTLTCQAFARPANCFGKFEQYLGEE